MCVSMCSSVVATKRVRREYLQPTQGEDNHEGNLLSLWNLQVPERLYGKNGDEQVGQDIECGIDEVESVIESV